MWTTGYKTADLEIQCVWHKDQLLHKELWLTLTEIIETDKAGNGTTLLPNVSPALVLVIILKHATYCYRCPIYIWGFSAWSDSTLIRISKDNKQIHTVYWAKPVSLNRDAISCPLLYSLKCMEIASLSYSLPCYFPALIQNGTWMSSDCAGSVIYVCHMWEEKLRYHLTPCCRGPGFLPVSPWFLSFFLFFFVWLLVVLSSLLLFLFCKVCIFCLFNHELFATRF